MNPIKKFIKKKIKAHERTNQLMALGIKKEEAKKIVKDGNYFKKSVTG